MSCKACEEETVVLFWYWWSCNIDGLIFREDGTWQYIDIFLRILSLAERFFSQTSYQVRVNGISLFTVKRCTKKTKNVSALLKILYQALQDGNLIKYKKYWISTLVRAFYVVVCKSVHVEYARLHVINIYPGQWLSKPLLNVFYCYYTFKVVSGTKNICMPQDIKWKTPNVINGMDERRMPRILI